MCPTSINDPLTMMDGNDLTFDAVERVRIVARAAVIRLLAIGATTHYKALEVLPMFSRIAALFLCPALVAASGCARSDDGTVVVPSRMDVRRVWDKAPPGTTASRQIVSDVFPPPPSAPPGPTVRRRPRPVSATPSRGLPDTSSGEQKPLTCRNVGEDRERYLVVCE